MPRPPSPARRAARALPLPLLLSACSETGLNAGTAVNSATPEIAVSPASLDFGAVALDGQATGVVRIENQGDATLTVSELALSGDAAFTLVQPFEQTWIPAGDALDVVLSYAPVNQADAGWLTIYSDDADEPAVPVALGGRGAFPQLELSPSPVALGQVELCEEDRATVQLRNVGEAPLEVDGVLLSGEALRLEDLAALPLSLEPGESTTATVVFEPLRAAAVAGELWVDSSDPGGARKADIAATGVVDGLVDVTDTFRQPDGPWERTDLMFFIDRSCSMKDDEANLVANLGVLAAELDAAESDWQLMVTIDDNGCHEGELIGRDTADVVGAFRSSLATAPGSFTEAGLTIAANGLERAVGGGCNDGFLRSDSKTMVVMVSDEPEQSPDPWTSYVSRMQAVAPTAAVVAIVGDVPDGCATAAPGTGYVDAAAATGGVFLSICAADWGEYFEVVGELATAEPTDRFPLSHEPDPATIEVTVDGEATAAWSYEPATWTVTLDAQPVPLALIEIRYTVDRECAADTGG